MSIRAWYSAVEHHPDEGDARKNTIIGFVLEFTLAHYRVLAIVGRGDLHDAFADESVKRLFENPAVAIRTKMVSTLWSAQVPGDVLARLWRPGGQTPSRPSLLFREPVEIIAEASSPERSTVHAALEDLILTVCSGGWLRQVQDRETFYKAEAEQAPLRSAWLLAPVVIVRPIVSETAQPTAPAVGSEAPKPDILSTLRQPVLDELAALDVHLPRALEDQMQASGYDTSRLSEDQQTRLARKRELRQQLRQWQALERQGWRYEHGALT